VTVYVVNNFILSFLSLHLLLISQQSYSMVLDKLYERFML